MDPITNLWRCPECGHVMNEVESKGYAGCPTGMHFVQHQACEEIDCPDCFGGHFRPCNVCGDSGRVINIPTTAGAH